MSKARSKRAHASGSKSNFFGVDLVMNPKAVEQAKIKLEKAQKAIESLKAAQDYAPAEEAWADFLMAASTLYSKLEQGAKSDGKSLAWFGRKKHDRRKDPLLRYLHYARNSEEHGIDRVVARKPGMESARGIKLGFGQRDPWQLRVLNQETLKPEGPPVKAFQEGQSIKLVRVFDDRFKDHCDPPEEHLGKALNSSCVIPTDVGELALAYLKSLVTEAESLVADSAASKIIAA